MPLFICKGYNMNKPNLEDFPIFFRDYASEVIDKDILNYLIEQKNTASDFFFAIGEEKSQYRYAESKWSIKEVLGHLCDTERIFVVRALKFARKESKELLGYDENDYVEAADFDRLPLDQLIKEFRIIRESSLSFFNTLSDDQLHRVGKAESKEYSPLLILYIIAGHVEHHIRVIKEKYL